MLAIPLGIVPWFPQQFADPFFVAKGLLAMVSTILLLVHMTHRWGKFHHSLGQRLRYITLLAFSVLITGASAEQVAEGTLVSYRHLGAVVVTLLLVVTAVVSIREDSAHPSGRSSRDTPGDTPGE